MPDSPLLRGLDADRTEVAPGAWLLRRYLTGAEQAGIAARCFELGRREAGFYTPIVRGGHPMSVRMLCLGRHWNARTYTYEDVRTDIDARPAPALPPELADHAARAAREAGFLFSPDLAIVNWYGPESRMGLHQDKDESAESIASGAPVVSWSIGDSARFLFGGLKRKDPVGDDPARIWRRLRVRRRVAAPVSRSDANPARHRAWRSRVRGPPQSDLPPVA